MVQLRIYQYSERGGDMSLPLISLLPKLGFFHTNLDSLSRAGEMSVDPAINIPAEMKKFGQESMILNGRL
ncbi:hypothetical protein LCGC14_1099330 [marine sediment metagenome]|uniref:Uncharacterized protein n=1 Tax=marine sediment metagenome TaxID=412755 RepID=A0A0F9MXT3_9ZZZZ